MSSSAIGQSSPMPRWAVSIASATPRPRSQRCSRKAMVRSQSGATSSQGSTSASGSTTTWAAASAMRLSGSETRSGKFRGADRSNRSSLPPAVGRCSDSAVTGRWMFILVLLKLHAVIPEAAKRLSGTHSSERVAWVPALRFAPAGMTARGVTPPPSAQLPPRTAAAVRRRSGAPSSSAAQPRRAARPLPLRAACISRARPPRRGG